MIFDNVEKVEAIDKAVAMLCDTVAKTFGPQGNGILLFNANGEARITKDGISVAKHIFSTVQAEDGVIQILREASQKTADTVGDGSTTTLILAKALYNEIKNFIQDHASNGQCNLVDLREQISKEVEQALRIIDTRKRDVSFDKDSPLSIRNVATIAANNDADTGDLITEAFTKIGENGTVLFDVEDSPKTYVEYIEGSKYNFGTISKDFFTDIRKQEATYENCKVLCLNSEVNSINDIKYAVIAAEKSPLVVFATGFSEAALQQISLNNIKINARILPINIVGNTFNRKDVLFDLSVLTGSPRYDSVPSLVENVVLGSCKKITASLFTTILTVEDTENIAIHKANLKAMCESEKDSGIKTHLNKRLECFRGNFAIVHVGGTTDVEVKEKYDRVEDAICAVKAALQGGVVEGGGFTYAYVANELLIDSSDVSPLGLALLAPLEYLCKSCYIDPISTFQGYSKEKTGFNFKTRKRCTLFEEGIIDPAEVVKESIKNAVSVVMQLIFVGAIIER